MFVFGKGISSFANLFFVSILQCGTNSKKFFQIIRTSVIHKFESNGVYTLIHCFAGR